MRTIRTLPRRRKETTKVRRRRPVRCSDVTTRTSKARTRRRIMTNCGNERGRRLGVARSRARR